MNKNKSTLFHMAGSWEILPTSEQIRLNKMFDDVLKTLEKRQPIFTNENNSIDNYFSDYSVVDNDWIILPSINRFKYVPLFGNDKSTKVKTAKNKATGYSAKKLMQATEV